ncbi:MULTISPECIES: hypothetical protein [unclassified Nonomuraea]|uniref:hypothetical protein n=1 Tax=unclassified Nonomuraea TaxID=2593643 RepID=UPI0034011780
MTARCAASDQAGLVNNLNDGLTWGVFPLLFTDHGLGLAAVGGGLLLAVAPLGDALLAGVLSAVVLGLGTAMVYPALIASVSDHAHPSWRANALGAYRFWRDVGYAAGALVAGVLAAVLGLGATRVKRASRSGRHPGRPRLGPHRPDDHTGHRRAARHRVDDRRRHGIGQLRPHLQPEQCHDGHPDGDRQPAA